MGRVFISFSSKNSAIAQAICHKLEENNIKSWIAPRDIPVGTKYSSVITRAIKDCSAVVLVFSEQSAKSAWVESEINIAFTNEKPIIPYKIDSSLLENYDEFYLMLNNRHWIDAYPDVDSHYTELISVVLQVVSETCNSNQITNRTKNRFSISVGFLKKYASLILALIILFVVLGLTCVGQYRNNKTQPGSNKQVVGTNIVSRTDFDRNATNDNMIYQVGDFYDDGEMIGVVFWVDGSGRHGKIISLQESLNYWEIAYPQKLIGADDRYNGMNNMHKVRQVPYWREKYPAFAWCDNLGDNWYIPSIEELITLISVADLINPILEIYGVKIITDYCNTIYWSSTETNYKVDDETLSAMCYDLEVGFNSMPRDINGRVRSIAIF